MRNRMFSTGRVLVLIFTAIFAAVCDDTTGPAMDDDFESSPLFAVSVMQVDRLGLPTINAAFLSEAADHELYNESAPADDDQFLPAFSEVIQARYGLDSAQADALADFVLPDVQPLGDLSGFPDGRRLEDDVIDVELGLIFGVFGPAVPSLQSDGVDANDVPFQGAFPYLAAPHTP